MAAQVPVFGKSLLDYLTEENRTTSEQALPEPCDCTHAFRRAFADVASGKETLITIPAGDYIIGETLVLPKGIFLDVHAHAEIRFSGFETDENAENIHVRGGIWRLHQPKDDAIAFSFLKASEITLENVKIYSEAAAAVGFFGGSDICLENCSFYGLAGTEAAPSAGILLGGICKDISFDGLYAHGCDRFIEMTPHTTLSHVSVKNLSSDSCLYFLHGTNATLDRAVVHGLSGCAHGDAVYFADCVLHKLNMRELDLHNGFFVFERNQIGNVQIERFHRRYDLDKNAATKATLLVTGQSCTLRADIVSLDSILRTGKLCPKVKLNVARRSSPLIQPDTPFVYRLDASVAENDTYIMPSGSFDSFRMNGNTPN